MTPFPQSNRDVAARELIALSARPPGEFVNILKNSYSLRSQSGWQSFWLESPQID